MKTERHLYAICTARVNGGEVGEGVMLLLRFCFRGWLSGVNIYIVVSRRLLTIFLLGLIVIMDYFVRSFQGRNIYSRRPSILNNIDLVLEINLHQPNSQTDIETVRQTLNIIY